MTFFEYETYANCVALSPDGSTIIAGHSDGSIFIWEIKVINYETLDTAPPDISDWLVSNDRMGNVTVQLVAFDNTGVARVKIEYSANSENYDRETWLGYQGGETWSGTLGDTFSNNDQVYLRAWAEDQSPQSNITTEYYSSNPYMVSTVRVIQINLNNSVSLSGNLTAEGECVTFSATDTNYYYLCKVVWEDD